MAAIARYSPSAPRAVRSRIGDALTLIRHARAGGRSARPLVEQYSPNLRVGHVDVEGRFHLDRQAALDRRTRQHAREPTSHVRELAQVVAVPLGAARPADAGRVGDRVSAGEEFTIGEPPVHHAVDAIHLVAEAVDGIGQLLGRIVAEVVGLSRLGTEIGHLPEQPLLDLDPAALVRWIEPAGLAAEIL